MRSDWTKSRLDHASYLLLFACLTCGVAIVPFHTKLALLPAAVVFGWSQIGGV